MSYNLHNGFDASGKLDMEALASVIENANPDILVLQEVSRGWLVNGRVDMISWLSVRLDMPYVFGPTADPLWGNAVFSRYPITSVAHYDLEPRNLFLLRGFTQVSIDLGESYLNVIATHFHHVDEGSDVRISQAEQLLDFWAGQLDTIIAGDFNARPASVEMQMMLAAGLTDSLSGRDDASVYTYHSAHPYQRIDYIWVSPDIQVLDSEVIFTTASDHHPVVAVISGQ
jgi:endonuclease/exonuclease/phosphatase family metal-dependent hydrolase